MGKGWMGGDPANTGLKGALNGHVSLSYVWLELWNCKWGFFFYSFSQCVLCLFGWAALLWHRISGSIKKKQAVQQIQWHLGLNWLLSTHIIWPGPPGGWLIWVHLNSNSADTSKWHPSMETFPFCACVWISTYLIPSLFAPQVRNHTGVRGRAVSGVLHEAMSWPDTSGSTLGQSHSNAVTVTGEYGHFSSQWCTRLLINLCPMCLYICVGMIWLSCIMLISAGQYTMTWIILYHDNDTYHDIPQ